MNTKPATATKTMKWALCAIPLAYLVFFSIRVLLHIDQKDMGDFYKDYFWAREFKQGANPYDVPSILVSLEKPDRPDYPFLYMPPSLFFFMPFTFMEYETARLAAFGIYAVAFFGTFVLLSRKLVDTAGHLPLYCCFAMFAFNGAVNKNLHTGNITMIESALLFLAFWCFLNGKIRRFVCLVLLASVFKIAPLFFLPLALYDRRHLRSSALLIAVFITIIVISFVLMQVSLSEWLPVARSAVGGYMDLSKAYINPSMYCLSIAIFDTLAAAGIGSPEALKPLVVAVFLLISAGALILTLGAGAGLLHEKSKSSKADLVVLAILIYAIVMPRFFDYMWVLLIPAVFRVLMTNEYARTIGPLMLLCVIPHREDTFPGLTPLFTLIGAYTPVIVAFFAWALHVRAIARRIRIPEAVAGGIRRFFPGKAVCESDGYGA